MKKALVAILVLLGLVAFSAWIELLVERRPPRAISVSAAISLKEPVEELARRFAALGDSGGKIALSFDASSTIVRQILDGAPCNLFISADRENVQRLIDARRVSADAVFAIATNELVIVVPRRARYAINEPRDLLRPEIQRVALCDPVVPLGHYADEYLRRVGILDSIRTRALRADNARAAMAAVEEGAVEAAIVYRTDAKRSENVRIVLTPPPGEQPRIEICVAPLSSRGDGEYHRVQAEVLARFTALLRSAEAQEVFGFAGFGPPPPSSQPASLP